VRVEGSWVVWVLSVCQFNVVRVFYTMSTVRTSGERHTLRSTPTALTNVEATAYSPGIGLSTLSINKTLLRLYNGSLALVVNTKHLAPNLKLASVARHREWFEDLKFALAIEDVLSVEFGNTFNRLCIAARVEVNDFLVRVLEREDDRVGREGGEGGMELLQGVLELSRSMSHCTREGARGAC
jgi:hypothetical protein